MKETIWQWIRKNIVIAVATTIVGTLLVFAINKMDAIYRQWILETQQNDQILDRLDELERKIMKVDSVTICLKSWQDNFRIYYFGSNHSKKH